MIFKLNKLIMNYNTAIFVIYLILFSNMISCQQKIIDLKLTNKLILEETILLTKTEQDILKENYEKEQEEKVKHEKNLNLNINNLNYTEVFSENKDLSHEPNDVLEEDWEIYGDPRVKHDIPLRKLYRSLRRQFDNKNFNFKTALVQLHNFEKMRDLQENPEKDKPSAKKKVKLAINVVESISECFSAFSDVLNKDFCYRKKKSHSPNICQCGYRYYNGACYYNCREGYLFNKGLCRNINNQSDAYSPKSKDNTEESIFECKYGFRKSNGYCYEDCAVYNMVNCHLFFLPGCASDTATCVSVNLNAAFSVVMGVLQIVAGILTIGNGGGVSKVFQTISEKGLLKGIYESAKRSAKKAFEIFTDPEKFDKFMIKIMRKTAEKSICKSMSSLLLKRTAQGPQDLPPEPSPENIIFSNPLIGTVTEEIPLLNLVSPIISVSKDCSGDNINPLNCAKSVMKLVSATDPTGILAGALSIAQAFMHPLCDDEDEKLENPDKYEQED
jgi:hypothetical protein